MAQTPLPDIELLTSGVSVRIAGSVYRCGREVFLVLECFIGSAPGKRVALSTALGGNAGAMGVAVDAFFGRHPALAARRSANVRGSALNCRVVRAETTRPRELAATSHRVTRRPAPLSPDDVRALAARYARGEITREAMSAAFWRARA